ncbi:hypothetical protein LX16_5223 [Stackebrandtia albiflava]|uniref:Uncharacterized protein n=1 Tax=Stackebrandtia albiflava TaxID=406432 RepID=A0A562ULL8_9ACTN|nr:hypothetical protein [Stackebrandtia albiflava]TWJ06486.1 hypothetical protein LX16_5223 [Stackebrandtia albiflava]
MATEDWEVPDADKAEQTAPVSDDEESDGDLPETDEADVADALEQTRAVPDDEYRPE